MGHPIPRNNLSWVVQLWWCTCDHCNHATSNVPEVCKRVYGGLSRTRDEAAPRSPWRVTTGVTSVDSNLQRLLNDITPRAYFVNNRLWFLNSAGPAPHFLGIGCLQCPLSCPLVYINFNHNLECWLLSPLATAYGSYSEKQKRDEGILWSSRGIDQESGTTSTASEEQQTLHSVYSTSCDACMCNLYSVLSLVPIGSRY